MKRLILLLGIIAVAASLLLVGCGEKNPRAPQGKAFAGQAVNTGAGSCNGNCGKQVTSGNDWCWCDNSCSRWGDCCNDYIEKCGSGFTTATTDSTPATTDSATATPDSATATTDSTTATTAGCTDNDINPSPLYEGDPYVKGIVTGHNTQNVNDPITDYCNDKGALVEVGCGPSGNLIKGERLCPIGESCLDGICISLCGNGNADEGETCFNCPGDVACIGGQTCENGECVSVPCEFNDDVCPQGLFCDEQKCQLVTCSDSDGDDIFTSGTVTENWSLSIAGGGLVGSMDSCLDDETVREFTCGSFNSRAEVSFVSCTDQFKVCIDGRCA